MPTEIKLIVESVDLLHCPISPCFGSEVEEVTLLDTIDEGVATLKQHSAERGVRVMRDKVMTMAQQVEFTRRHCPPSLPTVFAHSFCSPRR